MSKRKFSNLTNPSSWFNVLYREITCRISEDIFEDLFSKYGRPNASIRILIGMSVIKEGFGWSDRQLFEQCEFNLGVMRALGLQNLNDEIPVLSTYYDFNRKLQEYEKEHDIDLLDLCFKTITKEQVKYYDVCGQRVRMDSKLIKTNIANCTRVQLVAGVIKKFLASLGKNHKVRLTKSYDLELLAELRSKTPENITYHLDKEEQVKLFSRLGYLLKKLVSLYSQKDSDYYTSLARCYQDQYEDTDGGDDDDPVIEPVKKVDSGSLQSPHDREAAYREKGHGRAKKKVKGLHVSIAESCGSGLNLILSARTDKANVGEYEFLEQAIKDVSCISKPPREVWTDGGYDSLYNRIRMSTWGVNTWHLSKTKGSKLTYQFRIDGDQLHILDLVTGKEHQATKTKAGKWRIPNERKNTNYKYWTQKEIDSYLALNGLRPDPKQEYPNLRPSVESSIHEVFHRLDGGKSRYRGLARNKMSVKYTVLWVNQRRIGRFVCPIDKFGDEITENRVKRA